MKLRTKKGILLFIFGLCFVILSSIALVFRVGAENNDESPFEEVYTVGEFLQLPEVMVETPKGEVKGTPIVYFPDGTAKIMYSASFLDIGKYRVVYRATVDGVIYKKEYSFEVNNLLNSVSGVNDHIAYESVTLNGGTATGLNMRLSYGSVYTCNQLIDLSQFSKDDDLISFYIAPFVNGVKDCQIFYVKFEDFYNPQCYFTARIIYSSDSPEVAYVAARADTQANGQFYGAVDGKPDGWILGSIYGYGVRTSFQGNGFGDPNYQVKLRYDEETMTVYSYNPTKGENNYVIDFNSSYFSTGWSGFESNIVKLSVWADKYLEQETAGLTITHIAGIDLSSNYLNITEPSDIDINFEGYNKNELPQATVGHPYKIFDATSDELYTSEIIETNVYTAYGSNVQKVVNIKDGCFTPSIAVPHTIEYRVTDAFGNEKVRCVKIEVEQTATPILLQVDDTSLVGTLGEYLSVPKATVLSGGNGRVALTSALVFDDGTRYEVVEDRVRALHKGKAKLVYTAIDYANNSASIEVDVEIGDAQKPSMVYDPFLPNNYLVGGKYSIPKLMAEDFSAGTRKEIETECVITSAGEKQPTIEDGYFTVMGDGALTFTYKATDALQRMNEKTYTVPVLDIGLTDTLSLANFYSTENGTVTATDENMLLTATADNARFSPISKLNGRALTVSFKLEENSVYFEKIRFIVTDYRDASKTLEIVLERKYNSVKKLEVIAASINGGGSTMTEYLFNGDAKEVVLKLTDDLALGTTEIDVPTYMDGSPFNTFADFVYLDIVIEGVDIEAITNTESTAKAEIQLVELNGQPMTTAKRDRIKPQIMYMGERQTRADFGDEVELCAVQAFDVLNPYTVTKLTVTSPSGLIVTSKDGNQLKDIDANNIYTFMVNEYGAYTIMYTYKVGDGMEGNFSYKINVYDTNAPEIVFSAWKMEGKVNGEITLPNYTCSDNIDTADQIILKTTYLAPDYTSGVIEDGKFIPTQTGVYKITFIVIDSSKNVTIRTLECTVI